MFIIFSASDYIASSFRFEKLNYWKIEIILLLLFRNLIFCIRYNFFFLCYGVLESNSKFWKVEFADCIIISRILFLYLKTNFLHIIRCINYLNMRMTITSRTYMNEQWSSSHPEFVEFRNPTIFKFQYLNFVQSAICGILINIKIFQYTILQ